MAKIVYKGEGPLPTPPDPGTLDKIRQDVQQTLAKTVGAIVNPGILSPGTSIVPATAKPTPSPKWGVSPSPAPKVSVTPRVPPAGELRAFGALMYHFWEMQEAGFVEEWSLDIDPALLKSLSETLNNEPDLVSGILGAASPQASLGLLFALMDEQLPEREQGFLLDKLARSRKVSRQGHVDYQDTPQGIISVEQYKASMLTFFREQVFEAAETGNEEVTEQAVNDYKNALSQTFGMDFQGEGWTAVRLDFAYQGAVQTATAFEQWAASKSIQTDRFAYFRQIFGEMTLVNVWDDPGYRAESQGSTILIHIGEKGDLYMTPYNFIHELGHSFVNFSNKRMPLDTTAFPTIEGSTALTREGMGFPFPEYLLPPDLYFVASREVMGAEKYSLLSLPENCLGSQFLGTGLEPFPSICKVDVFRQSASLTNDEILADAFLNWVVGNARKTTGVTGLFETYQGVPWGFGETPLGAAWQTAFNKSVGVSGLNLALSRLSGNTASTFFNQHGVMPTVGGDNVGSISDNSYRIHYMPVSSENTLGTLNLDLGTEVRVYGQVPDNSIKDDSSAWLFVVLPDGRWGWVASNAITIDLSSVPAIDKTTYQNFISADDSSTISIVDFGNEIIR